MYPLGTAALFFFSTIKIKDQNKKEIVLHLVLCYYIHVLSRIIFVAAAMKMVKCVGYVVFSFIYY